MNESAPWFPEQNGDDLSSHRHRQLIGLLGFLLPWALLLLAGLRPTEGLPAWEPLGSVSAYYYTGAIAAFVGLLVVLAVFLLTYRGYNNGLGRVDRIVAVVAGVAAVLVAFFPTTAPVEGLQPSWWSPLTRTLHYVGAVALFSAFAFFCLFLFPRAGKQWKALDRDKKVRNAVHVACGVGILASMAWAGISAAGGGPIFWPEVVALELFAISWLVKGHALWTLRTAGRRTLARAKAILPGQEPTSP